jgi:hypothetical protein
VRRVEALRGVVVGPGQALVSGRRLASAGVGDGNTGGELDDGSTTDPRTKTLPDNGIRVKRWFPTSWTRARSRAAGRASVTEASMAPWSQYRVLPMLHGYWRATNAYVARRRRTPRNRRPETCHRRYRLTCAGRVAARPGRAGGRSRAGRAADGNRRRHPPRSRPGHGGRSPRRCAGQVDLPSRGRGNG